MRFHHTTLDNGLEVIAELNDDAHSIAAGFFVKADRVGAKHNAQTSEEDTFYHFTCLPEYLPRAFDVLADILRPTLREDDFETEKKVIIEEIRMYMDNPMSVAYEAAKAAHFGGHPLGNSILGTVAWAGDRPTREARPVRGRRAFEAILREEDLQQTIVGVSDGPPLESEDRYAAHLLATILGDHTSSHLYWALVDPGYADGAEISYQDYNQAGGFYTFLSCEPDDVDDNLGRIAEVCRDAMAKGVTEEELAQAKNKVLARSVLRSERPMGRLASLGFHWVYRRAYLPIEQELEAFSRVSVDQIRRLLREWPLWPMTVVSVGPTTEIQPPK